MLIPFIIQILLAPTVSVTAIKLRIFMIIAQFELCFMRVSTEVIGIT